MSGRFTFTAGNTLTAAQLNTNVMDGLPYRIVVGTTNVSMTSASPWSTGSANVTGLTGFTVNPYVMATCETTVGIAIIATADVTGTSTFTLRVNYYGASATARTIRWTAIQATSTTAAGS
jgi:hypothetical protein